MKRIEITVTPSGEANVQTHGFRGNECRAASQFLEQALGRRTGEQLTPEFYIQSTEQPRLREGT